MPNGETLNLQAQMNQDSNSTIYLVVCSWVNGFTSLGLSFFSSKVEEITEVTHSRLLLSKWINIRAHLEENMYLLASDDIGYFSVHSQITGCICCCKPHEDRDQINMLTKHLLSKGICQTLLGPGAKK